MKAAKILLVGSVACLLTIASVKAQGRIAFANSSTTRIYIGNVSLSFEPIPGTFVVLGTASTATFGIGPASAQIRLFAGTSSTSLSPVLIGTAADQPFVLNTSSTLAAAQGTFAGGNPLPLPGTDGTTPIFLMMTISGDAGTLGPFSSQSPIIQVIPSLNPAVATPVFGPPGTPNVWTTADKWSFFSGIGLRIGPPPIPEPSALALTSLSLGTMFFARRKNASLLKDSPSRLRM